MKSVSLKLSLFKQISKPARTLISSYCVNHEENIIFHDNYEKNDNLSLNNCLYLLYVCASYLRDNIYFP